MKKILIASAILAAALTAFYFIHEDLPKFLRAPSSLILAPVAIVDGTCYALGISGIYGKWIPVFFVNWVSALIFCYGLLAVKHRWMSKRSPAVSN